MKTALLVLLAVGLSGCVKNEDLRIKLENEGYKNIDIERNIFGDGELHFKATKNGKQVKGFTQMQLKPVLFFEGEPPGSW